MNRSAIKCIGFAAGLLLLSLISKAQVTTFPYLETFDAGPGGWTATTQSGTAWELGTPSAPGAPAPFSGSNCWGTDLDSGYRQASLAYLTSPSFHISSLNNPVFTFRQFRAMSTGIDGMSVEFNVNGIGWQILGAFNTPWAIGWYNSPSIIAGGQAAFTGTTGGNWIQSAFQLNLIGNVDSIRFRFAFRSNISFGSAQAGVFIDNVGVVDSIIIPDGVAITSIVNPQNVLTPGVVSPVNIFVENTSPTIIDTVNIGFSINGVIQNNVNIYANLLPGVPELIQFGNFTVPALAYDFCAWVTYPGSTPLVNDTLCSTYSINTGNSPPIFDNFENGNLGWTPSTNNPATQWELGLPFFGATVGAYSGSTAWDINLNVPYGSSALTTLTSPLFDLSNAGLTKLGFFINYKTEPSWDGVRLEYSINSGGSWQVLGSVNDPLATNWYNWASLNSSQLPAWQNISNGWQQATYILQSLSGLANVQFRYVFTSDGSINQDGFSMDDFSIIELPELDAGICGISSPIPFLSAGSNSQVSICVRNEGQLPISSLSCVYSINGAAPVSQTFPVNLSSLQSTSLTFNVPFVVPSGLYNVCVQITSPDSNAANNLFCDTLNTISSASINYIDDFDSGNILWAPGNSGAPTTNWELGTPAFGVTTGAYSGNTCWDINLALPYGGNAFAILNSPSFDFTNVSASDMRFFMNYNSESNWDGLRMEVSTNNGQSWGIVGFVGDPLASNWYNTTTIISSNTSGWSGNSQGWKEIKYRLDGYSGQPNLRFRFVFTSGATINLDGFSIDDFSIVLRDNFDPGICGISNPVNNLPAGTTSTVNFCLENNGQLPFSTVNCAYSINGGPAVNQTFNVNAQPLGQYPLTFSTPFTVPPGNYQICVFITTPDSNSSNNQRCLNLFAPQQLALPYFNNFDSISDGWGAINEGPPGTEWQWGVPAYGATTGAFSAPNAWDVNLNTIYGINANCALYSPVFDLNGTFDVKLRFRVNYETGSTSEGFRVDYRILPSSNWQTLGLLNDSRALNWYNSANLMNSNKPGWAGNSQGWKLTEFPIDSLNLQGQIQFRWVFLSDAISQPASGVSIDDVEVTTRFTSDAGIAAIIRPQDAAVTGISTPLDIRLKNYGISTVTNIQISYIHNNGSAVTNNWSGQLLTDSSVVLNLGNLIPNTGFNTLKVYLTWNQDQYLLNDTLELVYEGIIPPLIPYFTDFETGTSGWTVNNLSGVGSVWEWGSPSFAPTNTAYSGTSCWDINLLAPYANLSRSELYTPIFSTIGFTSLSMNFWLNYSTEFNADGTWMEFTTDGNTWNRLGSIGDPLGQNWFNSSLTQNNSGWAGSSQGWINCSYNINALVGSSYLRFRFVFISDITLNGAGVTLDDFSITGIVGNGEAVSSSSFHIFPNPSDGLVNWISSDEIPPGSIFELIAANGQQVWTERIQQSVRGGILSLPQAEEGLYQINLRGTNGEIFRSSRIVLRR